MLQKTFEWERLIHPTPTDAMVMRRKAIVNRILGNIDSEKDINAVIRLVSAALTGLRPEIAADLQYGEFLTKVTLEENEAFSSLLSETALDLQLTACLAVGELLTRKVTKQTWMEPRLSIASVCLSTAGLLPSAQGQHLMTIRENLISRSRELIAAGAIEIRKRPECDLSVLDELSPSGTVDAFWTELQPVLSSAFTALANASAIDRDELEVLWWIYNGRSRLFSKALADLPAYDVAFAGAIELVDSGLCPAPTSVNDIVLGFVARAAQRPRSPGKSLRTIIAAWPVEIVSSLLPVDDDEKSLVSKWPKALPLTWIAGKVAASGVTTGWEQEFASRTGMSADLKITPDSLANQMFTERTSQRLLSQFVWEES